VSDYFFAVLCLASPEVTIRGHMIVYRYAWRVSADRTYPFWTNCAEYFIQDVGPSRALEIVFADAWERIQPISEWSRAMR